VKRFVTVLIVAAGMSVLGSGAMAQDAAPKTGCDSFTWDVSHELAVLAQPATALEAGRNAKTAVRTELDRHYALRLAPQGSVKLAVKPENATVVEDAHAGLITFRVPKAGRYRVSISTGHWVDLLDGANLVVSRDFQGQRGCERIHKIVEFELSGNRNFTLQLSGGTEAITDLAITQARPAAETPR
jgi:hypothetical protein